MNYNELIQSQLIDHNVLYYDLKLKDKKKIEHNFHLYSINISQKSDVRTMTMFNKIHEYLNVGQYEIDQAYLKSHELNFLFDNMSDIILKYNLNQIDIKEGDKYMIVDTNIIFEVKRILKHKDIRIDFLYLRKYIPKTKNKNDLIFAQRFEKCDNYYFDIVFEEETIDLYRKRIEGVFKYLYEKTNYQNNVLICCQEINPILDALDIINKFKVFKIIDPILKTMTKYNERFFSKSISMLITRNCNFRILKINKDLRNNDDLLCFFQNDTSKVEKNIFQNNKYYIKRFDLYLYNIHSYLYKNKKIIDKLSLILPVKKQHPIIIIGDFNFKLRDDYFKELQEFLKKEEFISEFIALPFAKNIYEGIIYQI